MKEILDRINNIELTLKANDIGLQNVYDEFKKYGALELSGKMNLLNKRLDHYEREKNVMCFDLGIQSFPMNIRISLKIKTNFGEISQTHDYPPSLEYNIGGHLSNFYSSLLEELYNAHESRGGKFIGEEGCREWMENNGETIINKEPCLSPRFTKQSP
jgi:hypothetical protein